MLGAVLLVLAVPVLAGCGSSHHGTPAASHLEREDLLSVTHALARAQRSVALEVGAAKTAWRPLANGLPANTSTVSLAAVGAAVSAAENVGVPTPFREDDVDKLTGPASGLAGSFRSYTRLATRGWEQIRWAVQQASHGSTAAARFARANSALYIDSVYDAHFSLASIGPRLLAAYTSLGGPAAFGSSLTQREVTALARAYSEANRLHPHVAVKLGS